MNALMTSTGALCARVRDRRIGMSRHAARADRRAADQAERRTAHRRDAGRAVVLQGPGSGPWSGIGYAMGQQVAKDLGVKLVPVETTWGNSIAAIQANQIDVMFVLDATEERKKGVDFPDAPFFWYAQGCAAEGRDEVSRAGPISTAKT
jgi:ABC-type amino acid transport substrate-binding protein